ncbi:acyl-CoA thioesterase [Thermodesulfobacteriota bacterium]
MRWIETEETVRFNEVDQWGMAWYGHFMAWFEVGRMALLRKFDLLPEQIVELGYIAPVIRLNCEFKHPASFGDKIIIRAGVIKPEIAALIFKFEVCLKESGTLLANGETMQVLMTTDKKMIYKLTGELEGRIEEMVDYCQNGIDPS